MPFDPIAAPEASAIPLLVGAMSHTSQWSKLPLGIRAFGTSGSCMVRTSCFVLAGTPPKLSAGFTPPPCASQVYFDGILSPCLKAGDERSSADAACAPRNPPSTRAIVRHVCRFMDLLE